MSYGILTCICWLLVCAAVPPFWQNSGLTPAEQRGQEIYLRGSSASGREINAVLGDSSVELPASSVACVNCHGREGAGKPEGGVTPTNITWESLTRPYDVTHPSGRKHPPYTERLLKRAITMGLDPAGNRLHTVMPRYRLAQEDAADLLAYLKRLGKLADPGLTADAIRIGTVTVTEGQFAELGGAVKAALTAYFDEINKQGGIFSRRLELQAVQPTDSPADRIQALRKSIDQDQVFALVSAFTAGVDEEMAALLQEKEVPLLGAFTLYPQIRVPPHPYLFYLSSGLKDQAAVLAQFAAGKYAAQKPAAAIIHSSEKPTREAAAEIKKRCLAAGWKTVESFEVPRTGFAAADLVAKLREMTAQVVFFLAPSEIQEAFLEQAKKLDWRPNYLIPGLLASRKILDVPAETGAQVFLSVPSLPADQTAEALADYRKLAAAYKLPPQHLASQLTALACAKILVEGLKRAGRDVSRQKLIAALEGFYQFKTGLGPPVTFNANQRVGAPGAYVVTIEGEGRRFVPVGEWIKPD